MTQSNEYAEAQAERMTNNPNRVSEASRLEWYNEAKRLGIRNIEENDFSHISCTACREARNEVRAAQAAEKARETTFEDIKAAAKAPDIKVTVPYADVPVALRSFEFPALPPLTLAQRFERLVRRAERNGATLRLIIAPTEEFNALRDPRYRQIGDPTDLEGQLDIAEAYVGGLGWRNVPKR